MVLRSVLLRAGLTDSRMEGLADRLMECLTDGRIDGLGFTDGEPQGARETTAGCRVLW